MDINYVKILFVQLIFNYVLIKEENHSFDLQLINFPKQLIILITNKK